MKNINMKIEDNILTIKVDLLKEYGPSKSPNMNIVASTAGNVILSDVGNVMVELNVYKYHNSNWHISNNIMTIKSESLTIKEKIDLFDKYRNDPNQYYKIFTELGFSYIENNCNGYCPECENKSTCEVYIADTEEWNKLF
jgi:hypothetical protein